MDNDNGYEYEVSWTGTIFWLAKVCNAADKENTESFTLLLCEIPASEY